MVDGSAACIQRNKFCMECSVWFDERYREVLKSNWKKWWRCSWPSRVACALGKQGESAMRLWKTLPPKIPHMYRFFNVASRHNRKCVEDGIVLRAVRMCVRDFHRYARMKYDTKCAICRGAYPLDEVLATVPHHMFDLGGERMWSIDRMVKFGVPGCEITCARGSTMCSVHGGVGVSTRGMRQRTRSERQGPNSEDSEEEEEHSQRPGACGAPKARGDYSCNKVDPRGQARCNLHQKKMVREWLRNVTVVGWLQQVLTGWLGDEEGVSWGGGKGGL